jgi:hypothetical protein
MCQHRWNHFRLWHFKFKVSGIPIPSISREAIRIDKDGATG